MSAISIVNAKKNYNGVQALKGVSLEVKEGEFFGLLGPNGAGKTTLIHSIVGLCRLNNGTISVLENDVRRDYLKSRALIGFAPQDMNLDRFFSIRKILMYQAGFFGKKKQEQKEIVDHLLSQFHLEEKAHVQYYRLSGGMQKRLLVAKAMVSNPKVLILDEPTAGIDVEQRHELWNYLKNLNRDGTTIILTTHYIDEAEALCKRIGIIHLGEIREKGSPVDLIDRYCEKKVVLKVSEILDPQEFQDAPFRVEIKGKNLTAWGSQVGQIINQVHQVITKHPHCRLEDLHVERGTLEEVFLKVTGSRFEETMKESLEEGVSPGPPEGQ